MARKKYVCDFEATTNPDDCRVWGWGYMEIGKKSNFKISESMDEFMAFAVHSKADLYFHNLKYDGSFIINWLLSNGWEVSDSGRKGTFNTIISGMGQWYLIDISLGYTGNGKKKKKVHTRIYDSLKKLPFSVKEIGQAFKLGVLKGDIDYHKDRPIGYKMDALERKYIKKDLEIVCDAIETQFNQGLTKMTNGSDALQGYKDIITKKKFEKLFPVFSIEMNEQFRKAYRGGFTWFNEKRYKDKVIKEGLVYDVNSLYPAMMYNNPLPYGTPVYFEGEYEKDDEYNLYIQHLRCEFYLKEDKIPTIQIKKKLALFRDNEYLETSKGEIVDLYVSNVDLKLIKEHYNLYNVEYIDGWKFKSKVGMFNDYIDKWTYIKVNNSGAIKILAKLMLNSLYGKFATNPKMKEKIPYLKEDGSLGFTHSESEKKPVYTPMGVFITSYARELTIRTAQQCFDRIIYCDTDSIHLEGWEVPETIKDVIDDNKLGYWAHETSFVWGKYIRQKTYAYEEVLEKPEIVKKDGKWVETNYKFKVKCAGMSDRVKKKVKWEKFEVGYHDVQGNLKPKQVKGGVVLLDSPFTLKG